MKSKVRWKPNHEQPEVPLAQRLAQHPPGYLRIPVVERPKEREDDRTDQNVMEMGDDKVRVSELPIERRRREHDSRQAGDQKLKKKRDAEHHGGFENNLSAPHRRNPIEYLDPGRHRDHHGRKLKKIFPSGPSPDRKHMVRPHAQADEADRQRRRHHRRISKHRFAGKDGNDLVDKGECRQHQDINLGMTEYPEEVHPQDC